jgi:hypothetical protein
MKNVVFKTRMYVVLSLFFAIVLFGTSAKAQTSTKVIAVINRADWCPVCKANGARVMKEVIPACKDMSVQFVTNDLTNKKTIAQSKATLQKDNVLDAIEGKKSTGVIILVDSKTKKVLQIISVSEPTDKIVQTIKSEQG